MINYPMQYEMEQQIVDLIAEIEALKREKDHYIAEWSDACDENQGLLNQLTASQARERLLRDALEYYMSNGIDEHLYYTVKNALAQPTDDTALKAALAAERERVYEAVDRELEPRVSSAIRDIIEDAIRALGDEK